MQKIYWIKYLALISLTITLFGCSARKRAKQMTCVSIKSDELFQKIHDASLTYNWYQSKLDVKLETSKEKQEFKASLRIKKDSAIWSSIKVMSIPVALTLISQDSVKALVKQPKKQYLEAEMNYLQDQFNIDADYFALQDILSGRPIMVNKSTNYFVQCIDNELWMMTHSEKQAEKALKKRQDDMPYIIKYQINKTTYTIEKMEATKVVDGSQLIVNYNQFENIESYLIPTETSAYFYGIKDTVHLEFSSSKIKLNEPSTMPFNVTDSYEPIILE